MSNKDEDDDEIISAEFADKLLKKEILNIATKLKEGKSITSTERAMLQQAKVERSDRATFTPNKRTLAAACNISPTTLYVYLERKGFPAKQGKQGWPIERCQEWVERYRSGEVAADPTVARGNPDDLGYKSGAKYTLARLSEAERQLAADFKVAYEDNDLESSTQLLKPWLDISQKVQQFERVVAKDERDAGEVLSRSDVQAFLTMIGQALSYAEEAFLDRQAVVIVQMSEEAKDNPRMIRQQSKGMLYDKINESLDRACNEGKFARWLALALAEGLRPVTIKRPEPIVIEDPESDE